MNNEKKMFNQDEGKKNARLKQGDMFLAEQEIVLILFLTS